MKDISTEVRRLLRHEETYSKFVPSYPGVRLRKDWTGGSRFPEALEHVLDRLFEVPTSVITPTKISHRPLAAGDHVLYVEFGSWVGGSAIVAAGAMKARGLVPTVVCVDTWLGSYDFLDDHRDEYDLRRVDGYPTVYRDFLTNVVNSGHADAIVPFPQTTSHATRFLKKHGLDKFHVAYVDAGHDYGDCRDDMFFAGTLLFEGGRLMVDDYRHGSFPGVQRAVDDMGREYASTGSIGNVWFGQKCCWMPF